MGSGGGRVSVPLPQTPTPRAAKAIDGVAPSLVPVVEPLRERCSCRNLIGHAQVDARCLCLRYALDNPAGSEVVNDLCVNGVTKREEIEQSEGRCD